MERHTLMNMKVVLEGPEIAITEPEGGGVDPGQQVLPFLSSEQQLLYLEDELEGAGRSITALFAHSKEHTKRFAECRADLDRVWEQLGLLVDDKACHKDLVETKNNLKEVVSNARRDEERLASYQQHNEKRVDAALLIGTENGQRLTALEQAHNRLVTKCKEMEAGFAAYVASTARTIVILNERIEQLEGAQDG